MTVETRQEEINSPIANKLKGEHWEIVAETKMMAYMNNYEREVGHAGRRLDFVIGDRSGVPQAIVEVKSGTWNDLGQARDQIDLAAEISEKRMLIVATPRGMKEQFDAKFREEFLAYAAAQDVIIVDKKIGDLEGWEPVRDRLGSTVDDVQVVPMPGELPVFSEPECEPLQIRSGLMASALGSGTSSEAALEQVAPIFDSPSGQTIETYLVNSNEQEISSSEGLKQVNRFG